MNTLGEVLNYRADFSARLEALVGGGKRYTYKEYNERVNQLAHYLIEKNIAKGDRVAFLCKNHHAFPVIFMAIVKVGAIAVPINCRQTTEEIYYLIQDSKPKMIFYDDEFTQNIPSLDQLSFVATMIKVAVGSETHPSFEGLLVNKPTHDPGRSVDGDDAAIIMYTSGTTGKPKGVLCSHRNLYTAGESSGNAIDYHYGDRYLAVTPLFHISGILSIFNCIYFGKTMITLSHANPPDILDAIERERVTCLMTVPTLLIYMLPQIMSGEKDLDSIRIFICGGSTVPEKLIRQYDALGFPIVQVYGCTECSGAITFWKSNMGLEKCHSVGKKQLQGKVKIVNPDTLQEVPTGEVGEITFKGPQVCLGYWNNSEATQSTIKEGWVFTGDAGKIDEEGFVYVMDRYKDVIICGGANIYPAQVEEVIRQLEGVLEVALIGVPHEIWGEMPRAYVVKKEDSDLTEQDIMEHCGQRLATYKVTEVIFIDELPKNSLGKVVKPTLRKMAMEEQEINH
ncbi:class I adenylate-forming enzyme family protein [Hazenella coriacea]|uniref:Long-chain acyl-CoA synthetase n=1 Tax=Hazenella coriacea TaxID=1179467 RepID=A0A4R3L2E1_9BACL|nr:long-chain-fatty-acid--CoA ligase [Hazenella coriacea]TCS93619.1 long-chain acyl-CoA synthetase [Hazenella coriacea]